ncbi:hypothetical protein GGI21_005583, partial [Coemansia aciculifera]
MQPFGGLRRPNSAASAYTDSSKGNNYSRSEVSLSREQVVWSPQIAFGASDSAFGYPSFDGASLPPQLALSDMGDEYAEGALEDHHHNHGNIDMVLSASLDHTSLLPVPLKAVSNITCDKSPVYHNDVMPPTSTMSLKVPSLYRGESMVSTSSPKSLPRGLSLRSASSLASSPSASSLVLPTTPLSSPSAQSAANSLSIITMPDLSPITGRQHCLSPQFPSEATRMLKRVIMEKPRKSSAETSPLASRPVSQTLTPGRLRQALLPASAEPDEGHDAASVVSEMKAAFSYGTRSRASSVAHSLVSALDESDIGSGSGMPHTISPTKPLSEAMHSGDLAKGFSLSARTNPERMSTWSSS